MAISCLLRSLPKCFQGYSRQHVFAGLMMKSTSTLGSSNLNYYVQPRLADCQPNASIPLVQNANKHIIDFQQVKNFSTTPESKSKTLGNYSKLWSAERVLSVGLLGLIPVAFMAPSQITDCLLAVSLVMHNHWGIEAIIVDYVRPILFGPVIPKIAHSMVYAVSIATLVGLLYLIFNGCGFVNAIQLFWKL